MSYDIGALVLVTPSTETPVSLEEAKLWCKIEADETHEDDLLTSLIAAATGRYEAFTGRASLRQTFDWYLDDDDLCGLDEVLTPPRWPLVSVSSIRAFATTDNTDSGGTAMSTSAYYVDTAHEPGRIAPVSGGTWPVATRDLNAMIVRFVAGHSSGTSGVPDQAKERIKLMIAAAYEHRGDETQMGTVMDAVLRDDDLALPEWG